MESWMSRSCYCCESPAVGQGDHVPPLALFAVGTFASSPPMIVPSCTAHNQSKSSADEYLKYVLSSTAEFVPTTVREKTARSIVRHLRRRDAPLHRYGISQTAAGLTTGRTAPVNEELLEDGLSKVARGVYYHFHGGAKKLVGELAVYPIFLGLIDNAPPPIYATFANICALMENELSTSPLLGEHQDVFAFQVVDEPRFVMINIIFYRTKFVSVIKRLTD